ncbi:hypothetical protein ASG73_11880 [Janibacter sp. Soil728]|uniref:DUF4190 domain-containing protein n=1 Tax=Janibacter sp. Soil728 TaxID=1736393 RepID=UPI0006FC0517|nr:DUF4190 domain-containing protein [Janibacter sp. Soil728]KRE37005.1 hypothetical protein ASG73_11880 [Janibacter sp. Soil728]
MTTPQLPPPSPFPAQISHGGATAALVIGIVGLTLVPGLGIVAWVLGVKALQEIDAQPQAGYTNREYAKVGKILGIVGTVYFVGLILFICCYVGAILLTFGATASSTY